MKSIFKSAMLSLALAMGFVQMVFGATVFVNSGAAGANNGTSWTNAYTSLASTNTAAAGDIIKVHKSHSQTGLAASITWSNGTTDNPVRIICVDKDASDALAAGASVEFTANGTGPAGNIYSYGIYWKSTTGSLSTAVGTNGLQIHESGKFVLTGANGFSTSGASSRIKLINHEIDLSGASADTATVNTNANDFEMVGGIVRFRSSNTQTNFIGTTGDFDQMVFRGVRFIGTVTNLFAGLSSGSGYLRIIDSEPPTYTNIYGTTLPAGVAPNILLRGFTAGTLAAAALAPEMWWRTTGTVKALTSRYRTGGADDGSQANAYSWEMAAGSRAQAFTAWLDSPPITRWVSSGSKTVTVYVASGGTLKDDEFWVEVLSPSEAGSPTSQARFQSTRAAPLATPASLTTDGTSTWNGSNVGTKQKMSVSIAPTIAGPVTVRVFLAKTSTTVYVDPKLDIQ